MYDEKDGAHNIALGPELMNSLDRSRFSFLGRRFTKHFLFVVAAASLFALVAQSIEDNRENFSVFLFDYEFGLIRRGLLGELTSTVFSGFEPFYVYQAFYWLLLIGFYCLTLRLYWLACDFRDQKDRLEKALFCGVILVSPLFIKNAFYDFGRVDQLGLMALFGFALAPTHLKRVLIVLLPPVLILCHEGQLFFSVVPMTAIFLIDAFHRDALSSMRTLVPFALSVTVYTGLTVYFLLEAVPTADRQLVSTYFQSKSPFNNAERSWLLYDDLQANIDMALGRRQFAGRQFVNSPLYLIAIVLHWPIFAFIGILYRRAGARALKLACALAVLVVASQSAVYFIGIDYARWMANIFMSFVAIILFIVWRFQKAALLVEHAKAHLIVFIALFFIFLPIPRFGVVTP